MKAGGRLGIAGWVTVFVVVGLLFYLMTHLVMDSQGLPLRLDLTPAK
ncbi:hypothetical protein [Aestuariirhabdus litorea]|nr:hypothetical protein [Aestuariirhabdus litorea]